MSKLVVCGRPDELKELSAVTPQGMRRWELEVPNPTENLSVLRRLPGIADATLFGQAIHLLAEESGSEADISRHLHLENDPPSLRPIPPSLEDVSVTLPRTREKAGVSSVSEPPLKAPSAQPPAPTEAPPAEKPPVSGARPADSAARSLNGLLAMLLKEFS